MGEILVSKKGQTAQMVFEGYKNGFKYEDDFRGKGVEAILAIIARWLAERNSILVADKALGFGHLAGLLFGEIQEALNEHNREGTIGFDVDALTKELGDNIWFVLSMMISFLNAGLFDFDNIYKESRLTRAGSSVYDDLEKVAGEVLVATDIRKLPTEVERMLTLIFAAWRELHLSNPVHALERVSVANSFNYPEEYFTGIHPHTGRKLSRKDKIKQREHAATALRIIRTHVKQKGMMNGVLPPAEHRPYREWIVAFWRGQEALDELAGLLAR